MTITELNACYSTSMHIPYLLTAPEGFDPEKESLPLIVFLHGSGERGSDLEGVSAHGVPKLFRETGSCAAYPDLRVLTLSPQCPWDHIWNDLVLLVKDLIDEVVWKYHADPDRVSITGLSMGGYGSHAIATAYPNYFSALGMCCGGGVSWMSPVIAKMPVRIYHGLADSCVPCENSFVIEKALRDAGGNPETFYYEGVDHDSWVQAYEQSDLIPWLAAQSRKNR